MTILAILIALWFTLFVASFVYFGEHRAGRALRSAYSDYTLRKLALGVHREEAKMIASRNPSK